MADNTNNGPVLTAPDLKELEDKLLAAIKASESRASVVPPLGIITDMWENYEKEVLDDTTLVPAGAGIDKLLKHPVIRQLLRMSFVSACGGINQIIHQIPAGVSREVVMLSIDSEFGDLVVREGSAALQKAIARKQQEAGKQQEAEQVVTPSDPA